MRSSFAFTFIFFLCFSAMNAQKEFTKAQRFLSLKAFDLAIDTYKAALEKNPEYAEGYAELGRAYTMTNRLTEAAGSYEKAFSMNDNLLPIYKLQYAEVLKKLGMYDKSAAMLNLYASHDKAMAMHLMTSLERAKELLQADDKYELYQFPGNSTESDFGISFYEGKMVFCSFRKDIKRPDAMLNESYINATGSELFVMEKGTSSMLPVLFKQDNRDSEKIGPLSYTRNGALVCFMRNSFTSGPNQIYSDDSDMSIYIAKTTSDGNFVSYQPFPFNQMEYSYAFPSLSNDGSALYFSSNRPGGFGGFDLYVSYYQNGSWTDPENLGDKINTAGNEITPYFDGETLYFASDYHMGLGGFDNFATSALAGKWQTPENMGKGVNSPSDDYYLVPNFDDGSYYFSSNRLGGKGKDDIYQAMLLPAHREDLITNVEELEVPAAMDLRDLVQDNPGTGVAMNDENIQDEWGAASSAFERSVSLNDARIATIVRTSLADEAALNALSQVYFIQLASLKRTEGNVKDFSKLKSYGNLYRFFKDSAVKIKLGYFKEMSQAETILAKVRKAGYKDAFITTDVLAYSEFEVLSGTDSESGWIDNYNRESGYKVKLASYLDPMKFNVESVMQLGRIEQWSKGKWTIFILGGFDSLESAQQARVMAVNKGFKDAELVEDKQGILQRVKMH